MWHKKTVFQAKTELDNVLYVLKHFPWWIWRWCSTLFLVYVPKRADVFLGCVSSFDIRLMLEAIVLSKA